MKKTCYWMMAFALGSFTLGVTSCDDSEKTENPPPTKVEITVDPTSIADFPAEGGIQTITVTTDPANAVWKADPAQDWATVAKSGGTFTITVGENTGAERTNTITVSADNATPVVLNFKQLAVAVPEPLFIDELVGDWSYKGYYMEQNQITKQWSVAIDDHKIVLSKIDDTSIKIDKILNLQEGEPFHNTITATVNNTNKTVSIPHQVFTGGTASLDPDGWDVCFSAYLEDVPHAQVWGTGFTDVPITGESGSYTIDLQLGFEFGSLDDGTKITTSFLPLAADPAAETDIYWYSQVMGNVVLNQGYTEPASAPRKIAAKVAVNPEFEKMMKARVAR